MHKAKANETERRKIGNEEINENEYDSNKSEVSTAKSVSKMQIIM